MADQRPPAPQAGFPMAPMLPFMTQGWGGLPPNMQHLLQSNLAVAMQQQMQQQTGRNPTSAPPAPAAMPLSMPGLPLSAPLPHQTLSPASAAASAFSAPGLSTASLAKLAQPGAGAALDASLALGATVASAPVASMGGFPPHADAAAAVQPHEAVLQPAAGHSEVKPQGQAEGGAPPGPELPPAKATHEEVCADEQLFLNCMMALHEVLRIDPKIPVINQKPLDVHLLYCTVTARGGMEEVVQRKAWKEISGVFNFPETITSSSYQLRKAYVNLLWDFEQVYFHRKTGPLVPPPPGSYKTPALKSTAPAATPDGAANATPRIGSRGKKRKEAAMQGTPGGGPTPVPGGGVVGVQGSFAGAVAAGVSPPQAGGSYQAALTACAPGPGQPDLDLVPGTKGHVVVDAHFDCGYFVTVSLGGQDFRGMLCYPPPQHAASASTPAFPPPPGRKPRKGAQDPAMPRAARTAFAFFSQEAVGKVQKAEPELSAAELSKKLGELWACASEAEKEPFLALAAQDKLRYQNQLEAYNYRLASAASTRLAQEADAALAKQLSALGAQGVYVGGRALGEAGSTSQQAPHAQQDVGMHDAEHEGGQHPPSDADQQLAAQQAMAALAASVPLTLSSLPQGAVPLLPAASADEGGADSS